MKEPATVEVEVIGRGEVSEHARRLAREKVAALERVVKGPVLGARVVLTQEHNPRIPNPSRAEAEINLQGRLVRARTAAPSLDAAVDDVAERLQRHLRRYVDRMITRQREPSEWSHRVWSPPRPPTFERPIEEREIVRRKSFSFGPMSVEDAADALEDLDHEFFLFRDADTDTDAVLYWRDDGLLALIESRDAESADYGPVHERCRFSAPIALETSVSEMNEVGHRFLFFENAATGRGNILYRRYDGHYGLIEPADD